MPEKFRIDKNLVPGCQSRVWLVSHTDGNRIIFLAESDALIVQGLIALLLRLYSNRTAEEILNASVHFLSELGLRQHLSLSRANGLNSMINAMRRHAEKHAREKNTGSV